MQVGIHFMNFTLPGGPESLGPTMAATARAADEGGMSTFTLMDHWFQIPPIGAAE
jgi:alkanesulfonate monooxygenase SsuD/methylene tetrahydromethanopterin reductase-like flavin-dependent oxidoreductase (luciferase family)